MSTRFSLTYLESLPHHKSYRYRRLIGLFEPIKSRSTNVRPFSLMSSTRSPARAGTRSVSRPRIVGSCPRARIETATARRRVPRELRSREPCRSCCRFFLSSPEPHSRQIPDGSPRSPPPQTTPASTKIGSAPLASLCAPMVCPRPRRSPSTRTIKPMATYQHPRHGSPSRTTASRS